MRRRSKPTSAMTPARLGRALRHGVALVAAALSSSVPALAEDPAPAPLAVAFGSHPSLWGVSLSPDGSRIAFLRMHSSGVPVVSTMSLVDGSAHSVLASLPDVADVMWCDWANDERLLCGFYGIVKERRILYPITRLVAVDYDGGRMKVLLERKLRGDFAQYQDRIIDWLEDDPENVLVRVPSAEGSGVSRLDVYSGRTRVKKSDTRNVRTWLSDGRGEVRVYASGKMGAVTWRYRRPGERVWRKLQRRAGEALDGHYQPVGFGADPNKLYAIKPFEGRLALWSTVLDDDLETELVFSHPTVDIRDPLFLGSPKRLVAVGYYTDRPNLHFFDPRIEQIMERIGELFSDQIVSILAESRGGGHYLVLVRSDRNPGAYYRYTVETNQLLRITFAYPELSERTLAAVESVKYSARDGVRIPAYLTRPPGAAAGPVPAVVLPHGGPESRVDWEFDWLAQFLVARGYAVLQPNFRGSGGYGEEWAGEGGYKAWRTAIGDINDGLRYLVESGVADPARVCVLGWSYGGYAALLSSLEAPGRYRCVVSIAGVTDPGLLLDHARDYLGSRQATRFIGKDAALRDESSPLERAREFSVPVLLFHGEDDVNVRVSHSQKLAKALKKAKKPVELIEYEGADHGLRRDAFRIDMLTRIGAFLDRHTAAREAKAGD